MAPKKKSQYGERFTSQHGKEMCGQGLVAGKRNM